MLCADSLLDSRSVSEGHAHQCFIDRSSPLERTTLIVCRATLSDPLYPLLDVCKSGSSFRATWATAPAAVSLMVDTSEST